VTQPSGDYKPSRRDVLRPVEYVGGAAIAAIFTGVVVLVTARDLTLSLIVAGIAFIVVLVVLALLAMTVKPNAEESAELQEGDGGDVPPPAPEGPTRH
jgi:heme A synthase